MCSGREGMVSAKILTRLILLWYNPITEDDVKLRHCLGVFLPLFAFDNRSHQEIIEETFLPVVKTLLNAPMSSPLSKVNVGNVMDLLIQLTDVRNLAQFNITMETSQNNLLKSLESYVHDSLAMRLTNEILSDPEDADVKLFCKVLNQLNLCRKNVNTIRDLTELAKQLLEVFEANKLAKKLIEKFLATLEQLVTENAGSTVSNDQEMMITEPTTTTTTAEQQPEQQQPPTENEEHDKTIGGGDSSMCSSITDNERTSAQNNTTLTNADADSTLTNDDEERLANKHKLSSSSEKIVSKPKRSKLQDTRISNASIDFRVSHNKPPPQESDDDIDEEESEDEEEEEEDGQ